MYYMYILDYILYRIIYICVYTHVYILCIYNVFLYIHVNLIDTYGTKFGRQMSNNTDKEIYNFIIRIRCKITNLSLLDKSNKRQINKNKNPCSLTSVDLHMLEIQI